MHSLVAQTFFECAKLFVSDSSNHLPDTPICPEVWPRLSPCVVLFLFIVCKHDVYVNR